MLLLASRLNLTEGDVLNVELEAQFGDRRRIDIEMGRTVIEVKRSLAPQVRWPMRQRSLAATWRREAAA